MTKDALYYKPLLLNSTYDEMVRQALQGTPFYATEWPKFREAMNEVISSMNGHIPSADARGDL
jgi:hypothetical protein